MNGMKMKHIVTLLVALVMLASAGVTAYGQSSNESVVAVALRINGTLFWRAEAGGEWETAKVNQAFKSGNQIKTETGSKAIVMYPGSGTRVLVNENTELELITQGGGNNTRPTAERTKLMFGEIYSKVGSGKNYDVETPTSVASVRGTEFGTKTDGNESTYLVLESVIELSSGGTSVLLAENQMYTHKKGDPLNDGNTQTLSSGDAQNLVGWTEGVEPTWKMNINFEGGNSHDNDVTFNMTVSARDYEDGGVDGAANFPVTISASPAGMAFSPDGSSFENPAQVQLVSGVATLVAKATESATYTVSAEAEDAQPGVYQVEVGQGSKQITIELEYAKPDGSGTERIIIELEEQE